MRPDRIIIGADSPRAVDVLKTLYAPFNRNHERIVLMDVRSAELTKYAANAMLATKISFMNEIANIAEQVGADVEQVRRGIGSDPRIGYHFIYPGAGYGGSCFPKDVKALAYSVARARARAAAARRRRSGQRRSRSASCSRCSSAISTAGSPDARLRSGASRSSRTPTTCAKRRAARCSSSSGTRARACVRTIPKRPPKRERIFGERADLVLCEQPYAALEGADALVVVTEWKAFRSPDLERMRATLKEPVIFDGRNIFEPKAIEAAGIAYYGIGRGRSLVGV